MREWAEGNLAPGQTFGKPTAVAWFKKHYPLIKQGTVEMHVEVMSTNNGNIRQHHQSVKPGSGHDLLFKSGPGQFRLYDPSSDPSPVYDRSTEGFGESKDTPNPLENEEQIDEQTLVAASEFAYERDLQNYLAKNLEALEKGLEIYEDPDGELRGIEFPAGGGRRIDILALDSNRNFVVVELKVSKGHERVVGQIARYMAWVKENMEDKEEVRGIIVAKSIPEDLRLAASMIENLELFEYTMNIELSRIT